MTVPRDPDEIISDWLDEGPEGLPRSTAQAIAVSIRSIHQARHPTRVSWRVPNVTNRLALAATAVAVIAVGGLYALNVGSNVASPGGQAPPPTSTSSASPNPSLSTSTPSPSPAPSSPTSLVDVSTWVPYTSARYGFTISHPADWSVRPAARAWTFEADAPDPLSTAQDAFVMPNSIRVSVWSVVVDPGVTVESWIAAYCAKLNNTPCTGIEDRAVPVFVERRDGHPGLIVAFEDDVQAFVLTGNLMHVVAVWRAESSPVVSPYGGSRRLLEAFLATMTLGSGPPATPTPRPS